METVPSDWRDRYLSVKTAAAIVAMTPKAMYNAINRGNGPDTERPGRRIRIAGSALVKWVEGTASSSAPDYSEMPPERKRQAEELGNT
ncbi:MAG: helix-turn-helix domain-containing protein [Candidatus Sumerlaeaceae bacterium]